VSKRPKAPKGCYWREGTLWGRIQAGGRDYRWTLRTDDPKVASKRREIGRDRVVASLHYGDHRRTLSEATEAWGRFIVNKIGKKTLTRYLSSLAVLQPHLEGLYLDEIDKKLIGSIVESRQNTPYVPKARSTPSSSSQRRSSATLRLCPPCSTSASTRN
jgi:integrase/recombinase XerD